jgi:hypothetical protein
LAVTLLLTSAFAGSALADQPTNPNGHNLTLTSVTYSDPYGPNAVTYFNYRLTWNGRPPGLSHVDLQICSTLVSKINVANTTPGYVLGDGSAPNQCSLTTFTTDSTIVKWQSSVLTLVGDHYDFTLALNGTYGTGTTSWVSFAGSECEPPNGNTIEGPSCDTDVGCPGFPWCPPVCIPAAISAGPANQEICDTANPSAFSVTATGSSLSYQWYLEGQPINGANGSSYTPSSATPGTYNYSVTVTGGCGNPVSRSATLIVHQRTTVDALTSVNACQTNTAASFTANATGEGTLSYAWTLDGSPVGTSTSYSTPNNLSVGTHTVAVSVSGSSFCSPATASATVTVHQSTSVSSISNQDACASNTAATFTASATGEAPLSYAWTLDGNPVGTNSSSYTTANNLSVGEHTIGVTVTGASSCANASTSAKLTVHAATTVGALSNQDACQTSTAATFTASATGEGTLSYAWTLDGEAAGTNSSSFTTPSGLSVGAHSIGVTVTGSNFCDPATASATLTVHQSTSVGALSPQQVCAGTAATFTASATGEGTLSYQWKLDGNNVGTNSSSYTTPSNLSAGNHSVSVSVTGAASCAAATSSTTLTVHAATTVSALSPKEACSAQSPTFSVTATGEGLSYQWKLDGNNAGTNSNSFTIPTGLSNGEHTVSVTVTGSSYCNPASSSTTLTIKDCPPTCTLTQGAWGSYGGAGNVGSINAVIGGGLTVGSGARTFTVNATTYDIDCTVMRLPAGGSPAVLPSGANGFVSSNCLTTTSRSVKQGKTTITTDGLLTGIASKDKFNNVLLGQTLTLSLNVRGDANLGVTALCKYMRVELQNGGDARTLDQFGGIPSNVWNDLGPNPTVQSLLNLANSYLGGSTGTASYSEVNQAVDAINRLFDACPTKRYVTSCLPTAPVNLSSAVSQLASGPTPIGLCSNASAIGEDGSVVALSIPSSIIGVMRDLGLKTELSGIVQLRQMVRDGYDYLSFEDLNVAIQSLNEAVAQKRTIVPCSE